jgi:hypothetical protein
LVPNLNLGQSRHSSSNGIATATADTGSAQNAGNGDSGFDVEKELRKSRRKWKLLQRLNGIHNAAGLEAHDMFGLDESELDAMTSAPSSRPSTGREEAPGSSRGALGRAGKLAMCSAFYDPVSDILGNTSMRSGHSQKMPSLHDVDLYSEFGL